jgi:hypothetical protein
MELGDKATVAVLVLDQPFGDGFFVHGKKLRHCHHADDPARSLWLCARAERCTSPLDFAKNSLYPQHRTSLLSQAHHRDGSLTYRLGQPEQA